MKAILLSASLAVCALTANAQATSTVKNAQAAKARVEALNAVGKATATTYLLIGQRTDESAASSWFGLDSVSYARTPMKGTLLTQTSYYYNTPDWEGDEKTIYTLDAQERPAIVLVQRWNAGTSAFEDFYKTTNTYNASGELATQLNQQYVGGAWVDNIRASFTYDANGRLESSLMEEWNTATSAWENEERRFLAYNASGNLTLDSSELWYTSVSQWINFERTKVQYNANQQMSVYEYATWSTTQSAYKILWRETYTYNASNQMILAVSEVDDFSLGFILSSRNTIDYNSNGDTASVLVELYDAGSWVNWDRLTYNYSGNTLTSKTGETSGGFQPSWRVDREYVDYTFDGNGNLTHYRRREWDVPSQTIMDFQRYYYYYGAYTSGLTNVAKNELAITAYPNPATNVINVKGNFANSRQLTIKLYDIAGKLRTLQTEPANTNIVINVSGMAAGIYQLHVQDDKGKTSIEKIIIK